MVETYFFITFVLLGPLFPFFWPRVVFRGSSRSFLLRVLLRNFLDVLNLATAWCALGAYVRYVVVVVVVAG